MCRSDVLSIALCGIKIDMFACMHMSIDVP